MPASAATWRASSTTRATRTATSTSRRASSGFARRANPDDALLDVDVAVRVARVVDEARHVAADAGIDRRAVRQLEAPDVPAPDVPQLALETLRVGDLLARVVN